MKHNILVIAALALFCAFAASCGKKTDSDAQKDSMSMAKPATNMATPNAPSNINCTAATSTSGVKGVQVVGAPPNPSTSVTFTVTNDGNLNAFNYMANWGANTTADSSANSGTGNGVSTWTQGPDKPLPQFWFPKFRGQNSTNPTDWTAYDVVNVSTGSMTCKSTAFPNANITIQIVGGAGGT